MSQSINQQHNQPIKHNTAITPEPAVTARCGGNVVHGVMMDRPEYTVRDTVYQNDDPTLPTGLAGK